MGPAPSHERWCDVVNPEWFQQANPFGLESTTNPFARRAPPVSEAQRKAEAESAARVRAIEEHNRHKTAYDKTRMRIPSMGDEMPDILMAADLAARAERSRIAAEAYAREMERMAEQATLVAIQAAEAEIEGLERKHALRAAAAAYSEGASEAQSHLRGTRSRRQPDGLSHEPRSAPPRSDGQPDAARREAAVAARREPGVASIMTTGGSSPGTFGPISEEERTERGIKAFMDAARRAEAARDAAEPARAMATPTPPISHPEPKVDDESALWMRPEVTPQLRKRTEADHSESDNTSSRISQAAWLERQMDIPNQEGGSHRRVACKLNQ